MYSFDKSLGNFIIYQPSVDVSQSGTRHPWIIKADSCHSCYTNPITGWTASDDVIGNISIRFATLEEAVTYAKSNGLHYTVVPSKTKKIRKKAYQDNFIIRDKYTGKSK